MKTMITALMLSTAVPGLAGAADTGQLPCATTAECKQQAAKVGAAPVALGTLATSKTDQAEDQFYWLNKINRASAVMLVEEKIVPPELGRKLASGVNFTIEQAAKPDGKRPSDVLQIEKIITDSIGPDASFIHTGRSRQDMYATYRMANLRNQLLDFSDALNGMRARVLAAAAKNVNTIVPAYTNGVQAQPTSYADYLLGYEASFARDAERIHELYKRLNRCAMGMAVLANSIWPLNRKRMAELFGLTELSRIPSTPARSARPTFRSRPRRSSRPTRSASAPCSTTSTRNITRPGPGCCSTRPRPIPAARCPRSAILAS